MNEITQGNRKPGRPLHSKSADSIAYAAELKALKFCLSKEEMWLLREAKRNYKYYNEKVKEGSYSPMEDNAAKYLMIIQNLLKEMASRLYAKLKSVEQQKPSLLDGLSNQQKIDALKQLIERLEQVENGTSLIG